jgi:hypothetical protein
MTRHKSRALIPPARCTECGLWRGDPPEHVCDTCHDGGCYRANDDTSECEEEGMGTCGCPRHWDAYLCWCGIVCPDCDGYLTDPPEYLCPSCATGECLVLPVNHYPCHKSGQATCGCPHCWQLCGCTGQETTTNGGETR